MRCDHLLPTHFVFLTPDREMIECLLRQHLEGAHLGHLRDERYVLWSIPFCDCTEEDCECFDWRELPKKAARKLLRKQGYIGQAE